MSFENAVQKAIYNLLVSDSNVTSKVTGVFDFVPQDKAFPYITLGESFHVVSDSATVKGDDVNIVINVWSRGKGTGSTKGRMEAKEIQGAIYDALQYSEGSAVAAGYSFIAINWVDSTTFMDADGLTVHGVQNFRVMLQRV